MKKTILTLISALFLTLGTWAQSDVVSVNDALSIFSNGTLANAKAVLEKQGYHYKGVSTTMGRNHNWCKNIDLSADFLPQNYGKGNSSVFLLGADGKTVFLYVYNRTAFSGLQAQVKKLGYEIEKERDGSVLCTKDGRPTITFLQLQMPYPYCMMVTE